MKSLFYPPGGLMVWIFILLELLTFGGTLGAIMIQMASQPELHKSAAAHLDVALATGPVASGSLGASNSILGDTANLVFRLEKLIGDDRPGDIVVEGATHELAQNHFAFEFLGQYSVKGRQKPVDVYRLIAPLP